MTKAAYKYPQPYNSKGSKCHLINPDNRTFFGYALSRCGMELHGKPVDAEQVQPDDRCGSCEGWP